MVRDWRWLFHNVVVHRVCGWMWFLGIAPDVADRLHDATVPDGEMVQGERQ